MAAVTGKRAYWKLLITIVICEAVGILSGLLTMNDISTWYSTLQKPAWNPASYIFGPVWTILYLMMGIAWWLVIESDASQDDKRKAHVYFVIQLFLNFVWSILFFKFHAPDWAFVDIVLLILAVLITIFCFAKISKSAGWLLMPYILWICFAAVLNYTIWILNY
jgi:translocator protein